MRPSKKLFLALVCGHLCGAVVSAYAQPAEKNATPPKIEKLEEGEAPAITIRKPEGERKVTDKRAPGGKVKETKVTTGKSTYYVKPNNEGAGSVLPGDGESSSNRGSQWKVIEFGGEHVKEPVEPAPLPPKPPAASTPTKK